MREAKYQSDLIKKLESMFPGCFILKNDPSYIQGVPDIMVLWYDRWALLEVKLSTTAQVQANQEYYIERFGAMSFASFICPENEEEVLRALQQAFESPRRTRVSQS